MKTGQIRTRTHMTSLLYFRLSLTRVERWVIFATLAMIFFSPLILRAQDGLPDTAAACKRVQQQLTRQEIRCLCTPDIDQRSRIWNTEVVILGVLQSLGCEGSANTNALCADLKDFGNGMTHLSISVDGESPAPITTLEVDEEIVLEAKVFSQTCDGCDKQNKTCNDLFATELEGEIAWGSTNPDILELSAAGRTATVRARQPGSGQVCATSTDVKEIMGCIDITVSGSKVDVAFVIDHGGANAALMNPPDHFIPDKAIPALSSSFPALADDILKDWSLAFLTFGHLSSPSCDDLLTLRTLLPFTQNPAAVRAAFQAADWRLGDACLPDEEAVFLALLEVLQQQSTGNFRDGSRRAIVLISANPNPPSDSNAVINLAIAEGVQVYTINSLFGGSDYANSVRSVIRDQLMPISTSTNGRYFELYPQVPTGSNGILEGIITEILNHLVGMEMKAGAPLP